MPLTLNVGLSKQIGQPDYGSLGASRNVQVELDGGIMAIGVFAAANGSTAERASKSG